MYRTLVLDLDPTPEQKATLLTTVNEYTACFNAVAAEGYNSGCGSGIELHKRTYYSLRAEHPTLPAQLVVSSRMKATEVVKSALTHKRKGRKTTLPRTRCCSIRYDMRSCWVKWESSTCSLATVTGRLELAFSLPTYARRYITGSTGKVASADLVYKRRRWRLHVVVSLPAPDVAPTADVVGVDLGVVRPAVTSNNRFLGQRCWREQEARIFRLRRKLQAKGTKSAKRHLRRLSGKLFRQRRDHDHVLSKRIVQATPAGGTIVLEKLTDIRLRTKQRQGKQSRRLHSWSFAQLQGFTCYKAEEQGKRVVLVDPRKTSQTCNRCGYTNRANRPKQAVFCCCECGYQLNADLSAARNIAAKYQLARLGTPLTGGPPSNGLLCQSFVD
jgi:putative transposase